MDIQSLNAFIFVAEEGSFSIAAEKLHLTQPAVSKRVAGLEQRLGKPLFDRIGRKVGLTEAGAALLPHARAILQDLERAEQAILDLAGNVSGKLLLGTSHHIGLHRMPPVLRRFTQAYAAVNLDVAFMDSEQAYDQVMQGKLELAVVTLAPEHDSSILATPIWADPLEFMVAKDHPLADSLQVNLKTLSEYPVILPGMNTYTGQIAKGIFDREGLNLNVAMSTNYLETIRMMSSIGLGWTILPRSMLDQSLCKLDVAITTPQRTLGLIYHRGRSLSNAAQAFITELQADATSS